MHICVVVSTMFFNFHPYFGKIPILANSFQRVWNHQLDILHESSFVYSTICPAVLSCHRNNICLSFFEFLEPKRNNRNSTGWWAYSLSLHILFSVGWWFEIRILSWIHGVRHGKYFNSLFFLKDSYITTIIQLYFAFMNYPYSHPFSHLKLPPKTPPFSKPIPLKKESSSWYSRGTCSRSLLVQVGIPKSCVSFTRQNRPSGSVLISVEFF